MTEGKIPQSWQQSKLVLPHKPNKDTSYPAPLIKMPKIYGSASISLYINPYQTILIPNWQFTANS